MCRLPLWLCARIARSFDGCGARLAVDLLVLVMITGAIYGLITIGMDTSGTSAQSAQSRFGLGPCATAVVDPVLHLWCNFLHLYGWARSASGFGSLMF